MSFPLLPQGSAPWPTSINLTADELFNIWGTTLDMLQNGNFNSHRIRAHKNIIAQRALPALEAVNEQAGEQLHDWVDQVSRIMLQLWRELESHEAEKERDPSSINFFNIYATDTPLASGRPGRPRKQLSPEVLAWVASPDCGLSISALGKLLQVHRNTLARQLKQAGFTSRYSKISDEDLNDVVRDTLSKNPDSGIRYIAGHLRARYQLRVQRHRIDSAMKQVDVVGSHMRRMATAKTPRVPYHVSRPHALWHIDGHHKLITWGIVVHGVIDGYSRKITGLRASTNNQASTVFEMFLNSVQEHGPPSRVRGDRGGENRDVSIFMILLRGPNRASFMWGSSVHNTPIERLWVELGRRFGRQWRAFFRRLERLHLLNPGDKLHLWILHYLFLDLINGDCQSFIEEWNAHPMKNRTGRSPNDLELEGMIKHGVYRTEIKAFNFDDECEGMNPAEINTYYGYQSDGSSDRDIDSEEEDNSGEDTTEGADSDGEFTSEDLSTGVPEPWAPNVITADNDDNDTQFNIVTSETDDNIRHPAVDVPAAEFSSSRKLFKRFTKRLEKIGEEEPEGYGIREEEWNDGRYPDTEDLAVGRAGKMTAIHLPDHIWRPRARRWAQAHAILKQLLRNAS